MKTIQEKYFNWLYSQVFSVRDLFSESSYMIVCDIMHQMPFQVTVDHDDNRAADGLELRNEFIFSYDLMRVTPEDLVHLLTNDASVFEVLLALAKRADFLIEKTVPGWFCEFIENLRLSKYPDKKVQPGQHFTIDRVLRKFNDRKYTARGLGGIFPLKHPDQDQREVELWYQMAAYMTENHMY
jgi:hypothetical protein